MRTVRAVAVVLNGLVLLFVVALVCDREFRLREWWQYFFVLLGLVVPAVCGIALVLGKPHQSSVLSGVGKILSWMTCGAGALAVRVGFSELPVEKQLVAVGLGLLLLSSGVLSVFVLRMEGRPSG